VNSCLESSNLLGDCRLLVGRLVLVNDTLARCLVELLACEGKSGRGRGLVASGDRGLGCANSGLDLALHCLVALLRLLVGADALDLRLNVCHVCAFFRC
jgi:hypothetical protein